MSLSPNLHPEEVCTVACARCARFQQMTNADALARFGNVTVGELPFLVMESLGCRFASAEHRDVNNCSTIKCEARWVAESEVHLGLREDIIGGWGFGGR